MDGFMASPAPACRHPPWSLVLLQTPSVLVRRMKPTHTVVNCWFCNQDTVVPYGNRNCWDCPHCEQYNGFQEVCPTPAPATIQGPSEDQRTGSGSQGDVGSHGTDIGGFMFRPRPFPDSASHLSWGSPVKFFERRASVLHVREVLIHLGEYLHVGPLSVARPERGGQEAPARGEASP